MSEWISVEERLPASRTTVLAWDYDEPMLAFYGANPYLASIGKWYKIKECQSYDGRNDNVLTSVTHWQPLPAPPE